MKVINKEFTWVIPPANPVSCRKCAHVHDKKLPHNRDTLYYQTKFKLEQGRWPTWEDAMAHCGKAVKEAWSKALLERGVKLT